MALTQTQRYLAYGGIGVGGIGVIAFMYENNKKKKAAAAAAAAAAQQQAQQQAQYAYGYGSGIYGYGGTGLSYQPEVYGYGLGYYGYGVSGGGVVTAAATTNAMWAQAAVNQLTAQGYAGTDVQAALGVYLTGGTLTSSQESIVQAAIAVEGYPPQEGANGYPPAMNVGGTTGGGTGGGTVTMPIQPGGTPVSEQVPNGSGGWMWYTFPSQAALNTFYTSIGVTGGYFPNGLTSAQIMSALSAVGATPGDTAPTPGPGTEAPPPTSVSGLPSYGPA